jgi:hypothetical protein
MQSYREKNIARRITHLMMLFAEADDAGLVLGEGDGLVGYSTDWFFGIEIEIEGRGGGIGEIDRGKRKEVERDFTFRHVGPNCLHARGQHCGL